MRAGHVLVVASIRDGSNTRGSFIIYNSYINRVSFCAETAPVIIKQIFGVRSIGANIGGKLWQNLIFQSYRINIRQSLA